MYFESCRTLQDLKKLYRELALKNHPDMGGDVATMQAINAEYETAFARLRNAHNAAADEDHQSRETSREYPAVIDKLIHMVGITIEVCGSWVWVGGATREHREELKAAGLRWAPKKAMWYWHPAEEAPAKHHRPLTMARIRELHGSEKVDTDPLQAIA